MTIDLHAKAGTTPGTSAINLAAEVTLPGMGVVRTAISDDQGNYTLHPMPTDASDDPVDGTITVSSIMAHSASLAPMMVSLATAAPSVAQRPQPNSTAGGSFEALSRIFADADFSETKGRLATPLWSDAVNSPTEMLVQETFAKPAPLNVMAIEQCLAIDETDLPVAFVTRKKGPRDV